MRKAEVFDLILMFPDMLSITVLDSFYDAEINTALGKLVWAQHQMSKRHGFVAALKKEAIDSVNFYSDEILTLDSMIDLNPVNKATLLALKVLKLDTLSIWVTDWLGQVSDEETVTLEAIVEAIDTTQLVTTTNDLEENLKDVLILSEPRYLGDTLTAAAASNIEYFATQCPWLGGRSLYWGQILFQMTTDSTLSNTPFECPEAEPFSIPIVHSNNNVASGFIIYPNPASDEIHLTLPDGVMELAVISIEGVVLNSSRVQGKHVTIEVSDFAPGLYFIMIQTDDKLFTEKLNIIK